MTIATTVTSILSSQSKTFMRAIPPNAPAQARRKNCVRMENVTSSRRCPGASLFGRQLIFSRLNPINIVGTTGASKEGK